MLWMTVCVQVADEYLAPDVLSTVKEMKAVNFRRVPKMPVYGVAQPTSEVQQIMSYFTQNKCKKNGRFFNLIQKERNVFVIFAIITKRHTLIF